MPKVSAIYAAARCQPSTALVQGGSSGAPVKCARFQVQVETHEVLEEHEFEYMDYTHVSDYWFDWVSLEKAEAKERSTSAPPRRLKRAQSPVFERTKDPDFGCPGKVTNLRPCGARRALPSRCRRQPRSRRHSGGRRLGPEPEPAPEPPVAVQAELSELSELEIEAGAAEEQGGFRAWLEQRPPMIRLGNFRCETGIAWDFPLAKSEKRELLLQHITASERIAEEQASQAVQEVELARLGERRQRKSLESARATITRMRKKGRRRSSLGPLP
ncbi:unnamed protein product [Durusdinium trenchii]|uniref:Uncharacterized protein n=1 Tax=Durusdinium trenchii TaxID=1381693 RepID=A0ABP0QH64_9DINO